MSPNGRHTSLHGYAWYFTLLRPTLPAPWFAAPWTWVPRSSREGGPSLRVHQLRSGAALPPLPWLPLRLPKAYVNTHARTHAHTHTQTPHTRTRIHTHTHICLCACACVCLTITSLRASAGLGNGRDSQGSYPEKFPTPSGNISDHGKSTKMVASVLQKHIFSVVFQKRILTPVPRKSRISRNGLIEGTCVSACGRTCGRMQMEK